MRNDNKSPPRPGALKHAIVVTENLNIYAQAPFQNLSHDVAK